MTKILPEAREAAEDFAGSWKKYGWPSFMTDAMAEAFSRAILAERERQKERDAKVAEDVCRELAEIAGDGLVDGSFVNRTGQRIAQAIRSGT